MHIKTNAYKSNLANHAVSAGREVPDINMTFLTHVPYKDNATNMCGNF